VLINGSTGDMTVNGESHLDGDLNHGCRIKSKTWGRDWSWIFCRIGDIMQKLDELIVQLRDLRGQSILFINDNELKNGKIMEIHISIAENTYVLCHVESEKDDTGIISTVYRVDMNSLFEDTKSDKMEISKILDERIIKIQSELEKIITPEDLTTKLVEFV